MLIDFGKPLSGLRMGLMIYRNQSTYYLSIFYLYCNYFLLSNNSNYSIFPTPNIVVSELFL